MPLGRQGPARLRRGGVPRSAHRTRCQPHPGDRLIVRPSGWGTCSPTSGMHRRRAPVRLLRAPCPTRLGCWPVRGTPTGCPCGPSHLVRGGVSVRRGSSTRRMPGRWRSRRPRWSPLWPGATWRHAGPTRSVAAALRARTAPRGDAHGGARPRSGARQAESARGGQPATRASGSPAAGGPLAEPVRAASRCSPRRGVDAHAAAERPDERSGPEGAVEASGGPRARRFLGSPTNARPPRARLRRYSAPARRGRVAGCWDHGRCGPPPGTVAMLYWKK
jgi:hypothetical protein